MKKVTVVDNIAIQINELHEGTKQYLVSGLQNILKIGGLLLEQKGKLLHGQWIPWVESTLDFGIDQAGIYIKLFKNKKYIESNSECMQNLGMQSLLAEIREKQQKEKHKDTKDTKDIYIEGKYKTIIIDPPWDIKKIERKNIPQGKALDYPTMTLAEIQTLELKDIIDPAGCHLYLWTTQKYLPYSFEILQDWWGFKYIFTMTWHKNGGFQPFKLPQYNSEFILFGRMGDAPFLDTKNFFTCFDGKRRQHSRKPDKFYDLIKRVSPAPRIDYFSREKREGFSQFGNESDKF